VREESHSVSALTGRERQITELIRAGLSNKEIARRLNIGLSTTKSHVHNLLGKLNLQRRGQVAAWTGGHSQPAAGRAGTPSLMDEPERVMAGLAPVQRSAGPPG
jgi:DNA-binding CsgD family transcriptional regulator